MRFRYIVSFVFISAMISTTAFAACENKRELVALLPKVHLGTVKAVACDDEGEKDGAVHIAILVNGKPKTSFSIKFAASAYVLSLDTTISFGNAATQGLGVSTGDGRDGNGMHYWQISHDGKSVVDLGDAPALSPDHFMHGAFSTLISTTGKYQSYRYFYEVRHNRLVPTMAVGFQMSVPGKSTATLLNITSQNDFQEIKKTTLSSNDALLCQNGKIICW